MEKAYTLYVMNAAEMHTVFLGISYSEMQKWLAANCIKLETSYGFNYWLKEKELAEYAIPYSETGWKVCFSL